METRYYYLLRYVMLLTDVILVSACFIIGVKVSVQYGAQDGGNLYTYNLITSSLIWLVSAGISGLYFKKASKKPESVYSLTWRSISLHFLCFLVFLFFSNQTDFPRLFCIVFYLILTPGFLLSRFVGTALMSILAKKHAVRSSAAVLEMNSGGRELADYLLKQSVLKFVGSSDNYGSYIHDYDNKPLVKEQLKAVPASGIGEVYGYIQQLDIITCLIPLENIEHQFTKRLFDTVVSLTAIIFIYSWLYPVLALIVKRYSAGPVFFA